MYGSILNVLDTGLLALPWWGTSAAVLAMIFVTTVATTVFLHRAQTHRGVDLHPAVSHFFRFWLWLTTSIVTREWVAIHRKHHARCETEDDPHSPQVLGIRKVLFEGAELYGAEARNAATLEKYGRGTPDDWIERNVYTRFHVAGVVLLLAVDVALFGALGITAWALQMAAMPVMSAGVINGIGHYWGYRNFECKDAATNIMPWGIWFGGEELHNNHHAYPASAKFALRSGELDIGWAVIRSLETVGLARVRRLAPVPVVAAREQLDLDGLRAIIVARMHVLREYTSSVTIPILRSEFTQTRNASRRMWRSARRVLTRQKRLLDEPARRHLGELLSSSEMLATVYRFGERLQDLWEQSATSNEKLLAEFRAWIHEAEASGIAALEEFAGRLRGYDLVPVRA